jgi:predicted DNA repair protein MutK
LANEQQQALLNAVNDENIDIYAIFNEAINCGSYHCDVWVGGGNIVHSFSWLGRQFHCLELWVEQYFGGLSEITLSVLLNGITGIIAGGIVLAVVSLMSRLKNRQQTIQ